MQRELSETVKEILLKQCEIVGADYDSLDFTSEGSDWYMQYSWSKEQEDDFKAWLRLFLKKIAKSEWGQLSAFRNRSKRNIDLWIDQWCWNYGWVYQK